MRDPPALHHDRSLASLARPVRVLLVEDDQLDRMALERFVLRQRLPYELSTADSGADAMRKLKAQRFDVVLLDYMLGDMTGLELMPELHGTPAVFITALGNEELAANAIRQGAYGYLVKDAQRAYLNMLPLVIRNVLERKQAEDSLRETQRRLNTLLESLPGMAFRGTPAPERALLSVSQGCQELTGYSAAELVDAQAPAFAALVAPEDRDRVAAAVAEALQSGRPIDCTYRIQPRSGGQRWVRERAAVVHSETGAPLEIEGFLADISPQVHAEEALRRAKEESEEAIRVKDRFVNLIVHDLRAPLSTCTLTVQQLRQELRDFAEAHGIPEGTARRQRFAQLFDGLTGRAAEMLRMIDQLLLASRLRSGRLVPALRPVGAARIHSMVESLAPLAGQKGIGLTCTVPEGYRLLADPDLLAEVVQNLLTNAIKFTPSGGTITVGALPPDGHGLFVRDTGVGIAPENLPKLFQHEARLTTLGTAGERGTGLGLAMCHDILAAHGGRIGAQSVPGRGSEFQLHLPLTLPRLLTVALRAEDEKAAQVAVNGLQGELVAVHGSEEAVSLAKERTPQAVLLDSAAPAAARTLIALRKDLVLDTVPVLWLGAAEPPAGHIPDERLARPLLDEALRLALRLSFGG